MNNKLCNPDKLAKKTIDQHFIFTLSQQRYRHILAKSIHKDNINVHFTYLFISLYEEDMSTRTALRLNYYLSTLRKE